MKNERLLLYLQSVSLLFVLFWTIEQLDAGPLLDLKAGMIPGNKNEDKVTNNQASITSNKNDAFTDIIKFTKTNETGKQLVTETTHTPRCTIKDIIDNIQHLRKKRYVLKGDKWKINRLTYRLTKYPSKLTNRRQVDREIIKAFKVWSDITNLVFEEKLRGRVNIEIRFERRDHGDGDRFDGPGKILAHAFSPRTGGDVHFDDEENWTIDQPTGTNLFLIAAHEFGHSLGLDHSENQNALMFEHAPNYNPNFRLHEDDITGIQILYGDGSEKASGQDNTENIDEEEPDLCRDPAIDAVTKTENNNTYVFKGDYYWQILKGTIADGYPKKISEDWDGLPGHLDAAVTWPRNGKTYFFKGRNYWKFTNKEMDSGYPKLISTGFEGIPDDVDAAFVWKRNGRTYFFKGSQYWRFDSGKIPPVNSNYPRPIDNWSGLPNNINAAFQWYNEKTYFFKDDQYYRFNDGNFSIDIVRPPFPRLTSYWWFGCRPTALESNKTITQGIESDLPDLPVSTKGYGSNLPVSTKGYGSDLPVSTKGYESYLPVSTKGYGSDVPVSIAIATKQTQYILVNISFFVQCYFILK